MCSLNSGASALITTHILGTHRDQIAKRQSQVTMTEEKNIMCIIP
jgi:hypothetical protein